MNPDFMCVLKICDAGSIHARQIYKGRWSDLGALLPKDASEYPLRLQVEEGEYPYRIMFIVDNVDAPEKFTEAANGQYR